MNINRCCKQMLECSQHTYLIILGTENSSGLVHDKRRSSPSKGLCRTVQQTPQARKASAREFRGTLHAPGQLPVPRPCPQKAGWHLGGDHLQEMQ